MTNNWLYLKDGTALPNPAKGTNSITISTMVDGGRNVLGDFVGAPIGKDKISIDYQFPPMSDSEVRDFLNLFNREKKGKFVNTFMLYDPREGTWVEKTMYVSDRTLSPGTINKKTLIPNYWGNITLSLVEV